MFLPHLALDRRVHRGVCCAAVLPREVGGVLECADHAVAPRGVRVVQQLVMRGGWPGGLAPDRREREEEKLLRRVFQPPEKTQELLSVGKNRT